MEPTVSGNDIPIETEPVQSMESEINNYTYEVDNSAVCNLLEQLLSESIKKNDVLERLADSLDVVKETLTAEPEETATDDSGSSEPDETESSREELTEMLEGMKETFAALKETGESINETVSGNSLYLEEINNTTQTLKESYTEVSDNQISVNSYSLAIIITILFVASCIAGLHIAKMVWGKMR